ncbi:MAG TPA: 5'/3'-nucleotidase SurE [Acidimicrobiales bacterium]|nr:5'/3'-nucleotidase SurE [Acidimicrobiales bacterium]
MTEPKRVLVTNDDGIDSQGLMALARMSQESGFLPFVAAPSKNWSGASAALGPLANPDHVPVTSLTFPEVEGVEVFSVDAPPALIVMLAMLGGFGDPPDLLISGINKGPNTGRSTMYSATVATALVSSKFDCPGLAVSIGDGTEDGSEEWEWPTAAMVAAPLLVWLATAPLRTVLNLNVPNVKPDKVRGICQCDLAPLGGVHTSIVDKDETGIHIDLLPTQNEIPTGTDSAKLREGYATVTPLRSTAAVETDLPIMGWSKGLDFKT